ncbi:hypothetical protein ACI2K4_22395 [Micromonospora sp. NPDC050397]|uniref:hypothetical protein n=1 Tax=Micromonospora sp. NPDC050397 TaxID=3364279 RepID=UPI00384E72AB
MTLRNTRPSNEAGLGFLYAENDPIARVVAGWSPLALFVAIDVMMRVPILSPLCAALRITFTTLIAGIAAWTSYWHMVGRPRRSRRADA